MLLQVDGIGKKYPGKWALRDVSVEVGKEKILGVLSKNGAGRSTLFRIIANVTWATNGTVTIDGMQVGAKTRGITAFLPDVEPETGELITFMTNIFTLNAVTIAELYKSRWQIEMFFKWIKQNL